MLSQLSNIGIEKGFIEPANLSTVQKSYWKIIQWIIDTQIPEDNKVFVNKKIRDTIKDLS